MDYSPWRCKELDMAEKRSKHPHTETNTLKINYTPTEVLERGTLNANHGLWVTVMGHCAFLNCDNAPPWWLGLLEKRKPGHVLRLRVQGRSLYFFFSFALNLRLGFPRGSDGKASAHSVGDPGSIPGSGRPPGEGNGNPFQHSCLENPMDGGA